MKFPITPEYLEAAPQPIIDAVHGLENDILREICSRFRLTGELNEVAVNDIRILRSIGLDMDDIERCIAENTKSTIPQVEAALDRVVDMSRRYYDSLADKASITMPAHLVSAVDIAIIKAQTLDGYRNITRSLGFAVQSGSVRTFQPIAKAYQAALDKAELKVYSGSFTVQQAMEDAVRELADSGISIVDYASGHRDHADVAARRAIMTGLNQVTAKYSEAAAEVLETDLYEVTAHRGARDKGAGWQNHKSWQGKVYSTRSDSKYPNIYTVCGLGAVDGLRELIADTESTPFWKVYPSGHIPIRSLRKLTRRLSPMKDGSIPHMKRRRSSARSSARCANWSAAGSATMRLAW